LVLVVDKQMRARLHGEETTDMKGTLMFADDQ
jgi:hypothetical protein